MGALPFQSAIFPFAFQREWEALGREAPGELQGAGLRSLAARFEGRHPALAAQAYGWLAETAEASTEDRRVARERFEALQGRGSGGARWETLLRRCVQEATDERMIVPMLAAASVSSLVKAAAFGRFSTSAGAWFSTSRGVRIGAGGAAFAAEVPTFGFVSRALRGGREMEEAPPFAQELASTALTLGFLKSFASVGAKLAPYGFPGLQPAFTTLGLFSAHGIEESLAWRPPSDAGGRAADAVAATFSLSLGARLGERLLGRGVGNFQRELAWRGELALNRPPRHLAVRPALAPELPVLMSASSEGPGPRSDPGVWTSRAREAREKGYILDRGLSEYRKLFGLTLIGDLTRNIETRLEGLERPLRILELGAGDGVAARELKQRFGERIWLETNDRYPLPEGSRSDRHYLGDFAAAPLEGSYDLILSAYGPHAHHEGRFGQMVRKAVEHLAPGGEFAAILTASSLSRLDAPAWKRWSSFAQALRALEHGLLLRLEGAYSAHLFYARRLADRGPIDWEELFRAPPAVASASDASLRSLRKSLRAVTLRTEGREWKMEERAIDRLVENLAELGGEELVKSGAEWPQRLLDRYVADFRARFRRPPGAWKIQAWLDGLDPSPIWSKEIFTEEYLRWAAEARRESAGPRSPAAVLGLGAGLSALLAAGRAEAAADSGSSAWESWIWDWKTGAAVAGLLTAYGLGRLLRSRKPSAAAVPAKTPSDPAPEPFRLADVFWLQDRILDRHETEGESTLQPVRFDEMRPEGWVKGERKHIFRQLKNAQWQDWERELALQGLLTRLTQSLYLNDAEIVDAARLCWELSVRPEVGSEGRQLFEGAYIAFVNSPFFFPPGSAPVYRESLRLRRLYSDPKAELSHRLRAVDAFSALFRKFRLSNPVAWGETRMVRDSLEDFLAEGSVPRGTKEYYLLHNVHIQVEKRARHWVEARSRNARGSRRRDSSKD